MLFCTFGYRISSLIGRIGSAASFELRPGVLSLTPEVLGTMSRIRDFIEDQFLIEFDETFPPTSDLFKEGVMDSFGYIQLIRFLEKEFEIKFTEKEMTGDVMISLEQIELTVAQKVAERSVA